MSYYLIWATYIPKPYSWCVLREKETKMSSFTSDQLKVSTRGIGRVQNHDITIDKY